MFSASRAEAERKYPGREAIKGLSLESGGKRLMRFSPFMPSSSFFAKSRLCAAKASSGDNSGGTSPATCRRGDGRGRNEGS